MAKKVKINIRLLVPNSEVRKSKLVEILGEEWKNPYGVRIFIDKRPSKNPKHFTWKATEYSTGLGLGIDNITKRSELIQRLEEYFNDPSLTDLGRKDRKEQVTSLMESATKRFGYANPEEKLSDFDKEVWERLENLEESKGEE